MTFVLVGLRGSGNFLQRKEPTRNENDLALQALFPLPRGPRPARELLRKFRSLGLPHLLFPALQVGQDKRGGGLRVHLVLCPKRLPPLPLDLGLARGGGGGECLWTFVRGTRARLCLFCPFGSWRGGGCSFATDSPCLRRFLGCFSPLITARSTT